VIVPLRKDRHDVRSARNLLQKQGMHALHGGEESASAACKTMQGMHLQMHACALALDVKPVMTEACTPPAMTMSGMEAVTTSVMRQPALNAMRYATANVTRFCTSRPTCARALAHTCTLSSFLHQARSRAAGNADLCLASSIQDRAALRDAGLQSAISKTYHSDQQG
jgi:hypothetical protein